MPKLNYHALARSEAEAADLDYDLAVAHEAARLKKRAANARRDKAEAKRAQSKARKERARPHYDSSYSRRSEQKANTFARMIAAHVAEAVALD